jgi:hypothetical protein
MYDLDPTVAIDGIRQFLKLHATCGGACYDTPELRHGAGYRAVVACRCGDTIEFWLRDAVLCSDQLIEAAVAACADNALLPARRAPSRKAA